ncbi:hypothetical protein FE783_24710 [Paenibacillus mesophilus]|uniref:hypothetical protein n=1 Tax=Paenibacillus mesophilus TaxID=2582849 RepID=UPI00110E890F|nr:hypothetical protein [Paenibacillus mesophilus]TMV46844.1 hypothetical protein FE783_24710 [Paenibacillus mesophilus]
MKRLKTIVASTMTLALTLGGGLWAHHYVSAASTDAQAQTQPQDQGGKMFGGKRGAPGQDVRGLRGGHGGFGISDELATLLGTTKDELHTAIKSGKTLAAIASEKGVTVQSVVALLVKAPSEQVDKLLADGKLTQEQATQRKTELTDNATKFVNGELKGGFPGGGKGGPGERGGMHGGFGISDELATLLGTTKDELHTAIKSGKTLAAIASEKGVTVQSVVALLVKAPSEQVDKLLADGKLTQEQATQRKTELTDNATKFINGELKGGFPGGGKGGPGERGGMHGGFGISDELATLLGTTKDELHTAIKSGKTLAAIASEKGVTVQSVVALLVKAPSEQVDKLLADGKLTQEQATQRKTVLTDNATKFINGELKGGFPGGFPSGGKGGPGGKGGFGDKGGSRSGDKAAGASGQAVTS